MVLGQLLAQRQYREHRRKQRAEIEERRRARGADDGDAAEDLRRHVEQCADLQPVHCRADVELSRMCFHHL